MAYADFVTAMMALFMVLWLTAQDEKIKEAVERAFKNPFMSVTKESTGLIPNKEIQAVKSQEGHFDAASMVELNMLRRMAEDLMRQLESQADASSEQPVKLEWMPDGMRISIFDRARKPVFEPDSDHFTDYGNWVFSTLAWEISRYTHVFLLELEGHTERGRPARREDYTHWELTSDRANAARRKLIQHGVHGEQIRKVAGFADTQPMPEYEPDSESNRRVALLLKVKQGSRLAR